MERTKWWLAAGVSILASVLSTDKDVYAFKLRTHEVVANLALGRISGDGVTIDVPGIGPVPIHNAEVVSAVRTYPAFFRAGVLGPDVYPDLIGGQLWVHVNRGNEDGLANCPGTTGCVGSGETFERRKVSTWRSIDYGMYMLKRANEYYRAPANDDQRRKRLQALAFAYGYLSHMIGDAFAHSYVNEWVRSAFDYFNGNTGALYGPPTEELQHMAVEGYIDAHIAPVANTDLTIDTPVDFLVELYTERVPEQGGYSAAGAFGGMYFERLLEIRKELERLADRNRWAEGTWGSEVVQLALQIHGAAATLASFGTQIGDPITDIEDYFKRRLEIVNLMLRKWVVLSACVGQNILLGSNKGPGEILTTDACAIDFEDTPRAREIFQGRLNEAARFGANQSGFDYGRFASNIKKQEQFLLTVLDRALVFSPREDIRSLRVLAEQVEKCDSRLLEWESCDDACTWARKTCSTLVELAACLGCPKKGNRYYCDWTCGFMPHCLPCAGQVFQTVIDPVCTAHVNAAAPVCDFCSQNTICAHLQPLRDARDALDGFLETVLRDVVRKLVDAAKQKALETYAGPYVKDYIALHREFERRKARASASWFVNIAFLREDLTEDPNHLNLIFQKTTGLTGQLASNAATVAQAVQDTYNRTQAVAQNVLQTYIALQTGVTYPQIWQGVIEVLYRIARDQNFSALRDLEQSAYSWLDRFSFRNDQTQYETRLARFVALMAATDSLMSVRGPTAKLLRTSMRLSADVTDDGSGALDPALFHPVANAVRLTTLGFLGREGIHQLGVQAGLSGVDQRRFGFDSAFFEDGSTRAVSAICREVPHIVCDAIQSLDDPNRYSPTGLSIAGGTHVGAPPDQTDVDRSVTIWASRPQARHAGTCQLGLTDFLLAGMDETIAKIYRRVFLLPEYCNQPDLIIATSRTSPKPRIGQPVTFYFDVANVGGADAGSSRAELRIAGAAAPSVVAVPALPAGQSFTVTASQTYTTANVYRNAYDADASHQVVELHEMNNRKGHAFQVFAPTAVRPDLFVAEFRSTGRRWEWSGTQTRFSLRVGNAGLEAAPASIARVDIAGSTPGAKPLSINIPPLNPGDVRVFSFGYTLRGGNFKLTVYLDPADAIAETNEANNTATLTIRGF